MVKTLRQFVPLFVVMLLTLSCSLPGSEPTAADQTAELQATMAALQTALAQAQGAAQQTEPTLPPDSSATSEPAQPSPVLSSVTEMPPTEIPPAATSEPALPATPLAEAPALKLVLLSLDAGEPSGGWEYYTARFAVENQSSAWQSLLVDTGPGVVETEEGYTYDVEPVHYTAMVPILFGDPLTIPPGFRILGSSDDINGFENVLEVFFRVAQGAHPTRLTFQNYGAIELVSIQSPVFPVDGASFYANVGDTVEIPGKAKITFAQVQRSTYGIYQGVTVDIRFQNLDAGYETAAKAGCFMVDGQGFIRWNKEYTQFDAGPGQTTETRLGFYLWEPARAFRGGVDIDESKVGELLSNAKILCRGDFEVVLNLSLSPVVEIPPTSLPTIPPTSVPTSIPTTVPTDTPSPVPTTTPTSVPDNAPTTVTVYADQAWQSSGMTLSSGQQFWITASGGWTYWADQLAFMSPNGDDFICGASTCCEPLPSGRKGALIGRIGGEVFFVGDAGTFVASQSGILELRMNDCDDSLADNAGSMTATIQIGGQ